MALEKTFDVPIPLHDVAERWKQVQAERRPRARFSVVDEMHTRVHASEHEFDQVMADLREVGLAGREAAGNPAARGVAPGGAGGTFPGGTGGTPSPGGGKPGTTP